MVTIKEVLPGSLAEKAGIRARDIIISIDGNEINDILDYRFFVTDEKITLKIHRGPELFDVTIEKEEYDDIGLGFDTYLMDKQHSCRNKCIFCFIDQNPPGMRESIYFKDDDSRMSFLSGSYITLTNMTERDIDRIIKMHISPVNISVQTTEPDLRVEMMKNKRSGEVLSYIRTLADAGIKMNFQVVLCRGVNDGEHLERTLSDLESYYPAGQSVAIVPAGLTGHRKGLYPLEPFTPKECAGIIETINRYGDRCVEKYGTRLFYASDEFYIKAGMPIPPADYYDSYPQYENGVGMIRSMLDEFEQAKDYFPKKTNRRVSIATGEAAYPFISAMTEAIAKRVCGFECKVYCIENRFFGGSVTVAGLLTGGDIATQLSGKELGDELFITEYALRHGEDVFLDDMSVGELSEKLGVKITPASCDGWAFAEALLGKEL